MARSLLAGPASQIPVDSGHAAKMAPARRRPKKRNSGAAGRPCRSTASRMRSGDTRRLARQADHTAQCTRDRHPHRRRGVRGAAVELEEGLHIALLVAACHKQTSSGPGLTPASPTSRLRAFRPSSVDAKISVGTGDISGPGTQRSRLTASTTSRLSHPVSRRLPRRAARWRRALLLLHFLLQRPARKRPSPRWERALTCGN